MIQGQRADGHGVAGECHQADPVASQLAHQIGDGAENRIGPHLNALFGRKAASLDGFRYSKSFQRAGAGGPGRSRVTLLALEAGRADVALGTGGTRRAGRADHGATFGIANDSRRLGYVGDTVLEGLQGADCTVFTNPNASAWLLNLRGDDVPNTPVVT